MEEEDAEKDVEDVEEDFAAPRRTACGARASAERQVVEVRLLSMARRPSFWLPPSGSACSPRRRGRPGGAAAKKRKRRKELAKNAVLCFIMEPGSRDGQLRDRPAAPGGDDAPHSGGEKKDKVEAKPSGLRSERHSRPSLSKAAPPGPDSGPGGCDTCRPGCLEPF